MLEEGALFEKLWNEVTNEDYDDPVMLIGVRKEKIYALKGEIHTE